MTQSCVRWVGPKYFIIIAKSGQLANKFEQKANKMKTSPKKKITESHLGCKIFGQQLTVCYHNDYKKILKNYIIICKNKKKNKKIIEQTFWHAAGSLGTCVVQKVQSVGTCRWICQRYMGLAPLAATQQIAHAD